MLCSGGLGHYCMVALAKYLVTVDDLRGMGRYIFNTYDDGLLVGDDLLVLYMQIGDRNDVSVVEERQVFESVLVSEYFACCPRLWFGCVSLRAHTHRPYRHISDRVPKRLACFLR